MDCAKENSQLRGVQGATLGARICRAESSAGKRGEGKTGSVAGLSEGGQFLRRRHRNGSAGSDHGRGGGCCDRGAAAASSARFGTLGQPRDGKAGPAVPTPALRHSV